MNRAEELQNRWATARTITPGVTLNLHGDAAVVMGEADPAADKENRTGRGRYYWAWSEAKGCFILIKPDTKTQPGWYEYQDGEDD